MAQARRKTNTSIGFNLLRHVKHGLRESGFLLLAGVALYLILALVSFDPRDPAWTHTAAVPDINNLGGVAGAWFADIALYFFGYLAYLFPLGIAFGGWRLFKRNALSELDAEIVLFRALGVLVILGGGCGLATLQLHGIAGAASAGGELGRAVSENLVKAFSYSGGTLLLLALFLAGTTLATGLSWLGLFEFLGKLTLELFRWSEKVFHQLVLAGRRVWSWGAGLRSAPVSRRQSSARSEPPPAVPDPVPVNKLALSAVEEEGPAAVSTQRQTRIEPVFNGQVAAFVANEGRPLVGETATLVAEPIMPSAVDALAANRRKAAAAGDSRVPLPPLELLDLVPPSQNGYTAQALEEISRQVEVLLRHFGIEARVTCVKPGPVITCFELEPAPGVKVSQISNLSKDLARGLSVVSVRIVEVIPGKSVMGLEIPNKQREIVYLSEILKSPAYAKSNTPLTLALGKDIVGNSVVVNLARMPHLLVAGTTGSGKSVGINAMLLSLLYKAGPEEVRLILIDPKMLELSVYEGIPHLLAPVVTDMKEAANALRWCVAEMERRYRLMASLKVRNIAGYNRIVADALKAGSPLRDPLFKPDDYTEEGGQAPILEPLPFIVVVIDELADMMMIVGKKVDELIARLAQKARASGIHLILATQRPSVDVITGLIKANIPTRIAFQVSSKIDSRTILDQMGAEQLLGHGDMLYLPPGTGFPQRVHGAFVDDHEVNQVVEYMRQAGEPQYVDDILEEPVEGVRGSFGEAAGSSVEGEGDPLYDQAVRIVTETRKASISGVQRRLKIGYNRAARMIEEMENAGLVGPLQSNGGREVLAPPPPAD